jgi:hypothetical protein
MVSGGTKMSAWTDALTDERIEEAKVVYAALQAVGWGNLSGKDKAILEIIGYLILERDDISIAGQVDADISEATHA